MHLLGIVTLKQRGHCLIWMPCQVANCSQMFSASTAPCGAAADQLGAVSLTPDAVSLTTDAVSLTPGAAVARTEPLPGVQSILPTFKGKPGADAKQRPVNFTPDPPVSHVSTLAHQHTTQACMVMLLLLLSASRSCCQQQSSQPGALLPMCQTSCHS